MISYDYRTHGVCAPFIHVELDDTGTTIEDVVFYGGCAGNLAAIPKLIRGRSVDEVVSLLAGNTCGPRPTSCPDQLTHALRAAKALAVQA